MDTLPQTCQVCKKPDGVDCDHRKSACPGCGEERVSWHYWCCNKFMCDSCFAAHDCSRRRAGM